MYLFIQPKLIGLYQISSKYLLQEKESTVHIVWNEMKVKKRENFNFWWKCKCVNLKFSEIHDQ